MALPTGFWKNLSPDSMAELLRVQLQAVKTSALGHLHEAATLENARDVQDAQAIHVPFRARILYHRHRLERSSTLLKEALKAWCEAIPGDDDEANQMSFHAVDTAQADGTLAVILQLSDKLADFDTEITLDDSPPPTNFTPVHMTPTTGAADMESRVTLPKLSLCTFNGDLHKWTEFWDVFNATIHTKPMKNVIKFSYLKGILKDKAALSLEGIPITDANYEEAITILKSRFGDRNTILNSLWCDLRSIPVMSTRFTEFRGTVDKLEKTVRLLRANGEDMDAPSLVQMILPKIPYSIQLEIAKSKNPEELWTLDSLRCALTSMVKLKESVFQTSPRALEERGDVTKRYNRSPDTKTHAHAVQTGLKSQRTTKPDELMKNQANGMKKVYPCLFCTEEHRTETCTKFVTWNDRKTRLDELDRCARCFRKGHKSQECQSLDKKCYHCKKKGHNRALCFKIMPKESHRNPPSRTTVSVALTDERDTQEGSNTQKPRQYVSSTEGKSSITMNVQSNRNKKQLLIAETWINSPNDPGNPKKATVFLDAGSEISFINKSFAKKLGITGGTNDPITVYTFASKEPRHYDSKLLRFDVALTDGYMMTLEANTFPSLTGQLAQIRYNTEDIDYLKRWPSTELSRPLTSSDEYVTPDKLLGIDYFWDIVEPHHKVRLPSGLYLIPSKFGLLLSGKQFPGTESDDEQHRDRDLMVHTVINQSVPDLKHPAASPHTHPTPLNLEDFWSLERIGITEDVSLDTEDDGIAMQKFKDTVKFENNRYMVCWPWKDQLKKSLATNYKLALGRFKSLHRKLSNDQDLNDKYSDTMKEQLEKGIIERVPDNEIDIVGHNIHYLPHHAVVTPLKSTTKVRIVFDASSKTSKDQLSLNEAMYRDPIILPMLCGMLLRFRIDPIVALSDVEKAFLQLGLQTKSTSQLIKVLGQQWCISTDTLTVSIKESLNDKSCRTKREVLMFLASLFDPMGLISPVTLNGKLFLQELWKMKLTWDEPMKQNLKTRWDDIQQSILHNIGQLSFPRMISETSITHDITHAVYIFTDASAVAYSAVAYLVTKTPQKTQSMLLFTKSRLAPKKNMTIPRLELLGLLIGTRLMHFVCAELKSKLEVIDQVILTDSECCLHWLNSKKSLSRFVSNRVSEIKDKAPQVTFYKVPTSANPADLATRPGISTTNLIEDPNWQHGPLWLTQARENWPLKSGLYQKITSTSLLKFGQNTRQIVTS